MAGPSILVLGFATPTVISLWSPAPGPQSWAGAAPSAGAASLWALHSAMLSMGVTALIVSAALTVYRWALPRRLLHGILFLILLDVFYRVAYGGPVSPGLLHAVRTTSERESVELLAGHPALTASLSLAALLACIGLKVSWSTAPRLSSRRCLQLTMASLSLIAGSMALGMLSIQNARALSAAVVAEVKGVFPIDCAAAFGIVAVEALQTHRDEAKRAAFTFDDPHLRDAGARRGASEVYVIVIGETSRRANWSLFGYSRPTTPQLDAIKDRLVMFSRMTSNATNTVLSLPMVLTGASPDAWEVARSQKSIVALLRQAGFETFWISNQERPALASDPIMQIAREAEHVSFPDDLPRAPERDPFDSNLITRFDAALARLPQGAKAVFFLHMEGSHFGYRERYPAESARFPDGQRPPRDLPGRQMRLVDEYDNSIYFTSQNIRSAIDRLDRCRCKAALMFFSDHGERLFDQGLRDADFGHGFPAVSAQEIAVPFFIWFSASYRASNPQLLERLEASSRSPAQLRNLFESIVDLTGVDYGHRAAASSLFSEDWRPPHSLQVLTLEENVITLAPEQASSQAAR
ncbi:MAG TPA: phosphoethanolamine transferase [Steroidobacteraceae bacterium]|nr:phosphoethanolamine transferase [Steroidobacteraceae bacterium]